MQRRKPSLGRSKTDIRREMTPCTRHPADSLHMPILSSIPALPSPLQILRSSLAGEGAVCMQYVWVFLQNLYLQLATCSQGDWQHTLEVIQTAPARRQNKQPSANALIPEQAPAGLLQCIAASVLSWIHYITGHYPFKFPHTFCRSASVCWRHSQLRQQ